MEKQGNMNTLYPITLGQCIPLVDKIAQRESEQITLSLELGKQIVRLVANSPDKAPLYKKLARDITSARGKLITSAKISEYEQLFLSFPERGSVTELSKTLLSDLTTEMVLKLSKKSLDKTATVVVEKSKVLRLFHQIERLLRRLERLIGDDILEDRECLQITGKLNSLTERLFLVSQALKKDRKMQLDLFTRASDN